MSLKKNFLKVCDTFGQREVGRRIGYSPTTVNQVYKGVYPKPEPVLTAAFKVFGDMNLENVPCPVLGEIHKNICAKYRAWALVDKVHQDLSYRRVKSACLNCIQGAKDV